MRRADRPILGNLSHIRVLLNGQSAAAPSIGMDGDDILRDLGKSEEEIKDLFEKGVIAKKDLVSTFKGRVKAE